MANAAEARRTIDEGRGTAKGGARSVHLTKVYGSGDMAVRALDDVSVVLPEGRFTAIMGPSGAGKSTLMHCVAGLEEATSGKVYVGDQELGVLSDRRLLAVHERTRELGLLRAVGATRPQIRSMVRWESVIVALLGTAGGLGLGVFLGWGLGGALGNPFAPPVVQLVVIALVGAVAGALAAIRPARRAARLAILSAISAP